MGMIRDALRKTLRARETETVKDAINRKMIQLSKMFFKKKYGVKELKDAIEKCGIDQGDIVLVHSAWRSFYNFLGWPEDVVDVIIEIVGKDGIVLMPSYGNDKTFFDVDNTPSSAGVISEVFRNREDVRRSRCSHFSVAAWGIRSEEIINDHENSIYGFDEHSPCYKITQMKNAKVLFLGLGKRPSKISIFHCAGWTSRSSDTKLMNLYTASYQSSLKYDGRVYSRQMVDRLSGHGNDEKVFRKILLSLQSLKKIKISNLDIVSINASDGFETAKKYIGRGIYCYKNMNGLYSNGFTLIF